MADLAAEVTNSLDRGGRGGMLAPFRIFDGTIGQPGLGFNNEVGLGLWRSGPGTMHLVSSNNNMLNVSPTGIASPIKLTIFGSEVFKAPGFKNWQQINSGGNLYFVPSDTADGEDFNAAKAIFFDSTGKLNLSSGGLGVTGGLTVVGNVTFNNSAVSISGASSFVYDGSGQFVVSGSTGAMPEDVGVNHKLQVRNLTGAGNAAFMTFHRTGSFASGFGLDIDNKWKVGGWSMGANAYQILHEQNSFVVSSTSLSAGAKFVTANAFSGGYTYLGSYNGALDPQTFQTFGMTPGSTITAITRIAGQVFRILVNGSGPIILPSYVKLASGTVWGTTQSIVSLWTDGAIIWATVTPFST